MCRRVAVCALAATALLAAPSGAHARLRSASKSPTYTPVATCFVEVSSTVKETAVNAFGELSARPCTLLMCMHLLRYCMPHHSNLGCKQLALHHERYLELLHACCVHNRQSVWRYVSVTFGHTYTSLAVLDLYHMYCSGIGDVSVLKETFDGRLNATAEILLDSKIHCNSNGQKTLACASTWVDAQAFAQVRSVCVCILSHVVELATRCKSSAPTPCEGCGSCGFQDDEHA